MTYNPDLILDILSHTAINGDAFYAGHPAETPFRIPLGRTYSGDEYTANMGNTLVVARPGTGQDLHLHGLIYQLAPFIADGTARLWLADPTGTVAPALLDTYAFHRVATTHEDTAHLIDDYLADIAAAAQRPHTGEQADNPATRSHPLNILFITNYTNFLNRLGPKRAHRGANTYAQKMETILRNRGPFHKVVAYTHTLPVKNVAHFQHRLAGFLGLHTTAHALNALAYTVETDPFVLCRNEGVPAAFYPRYPGIFTAFTGGHHIPFRVAHLDAETTTDRLRAIGLA